MGITVGKNKTKIGCKRTEPRKVSWLGRTKIKKRKEFESKPRKISFLKRVPLRKVSKKQAIINHKWSEVVALKTIMLDRRSQWSGEYVMGILVGHHIIRRRFNIHTYANCYICTVSEHDFIHLHNIDVRVYPNKEAWEKRNGNSL